ncbi:hypothetical protein CFOL_v3_24232 [Cephalotus follicularis]|uniref:Uncharacterized protein n=1 Tax=Cephalotus follicularis TaxID=3775 RepID=A0A1Q3CKZ3_CEPFO|nr:hypothetical protein CFOL_v3_24232 [Cephalotus follicularis]
MEEDDHLELQLLPSQHSIASSSRMTPLPSDASLRHRSKATVSDHVLERPPSLDLQLSISLKPMQPPQNCVLTGPICELGDTRPDTGCVETLKWQAAEQIRLAAIEKGYAERIRELTRREMELAQSEFARARQMWERAREEVERAERMKERATRRIDSTCMEITCQSCRQTFRS